MRQTTHHVAFLMAALAVATPAVADFCAELEVVPVMGAPREEPPESGLGRDRDAGKPGGQAGFSASEVLDLRLEVELTGDIPAFGLLRLELVSPNGHLYERQLVPVSTDAERADTSTAVDGYPFPLEVQTLRPGEAEGALEGAVFTLPVAGTAIASSGLYGHWQARLTLDGEPITCEKAFGFVIRP